MASQLCAAGPPCRRCLHPYFPARNSTDPAALSGAMISGSRRVLVGVRASQGDGSYLGLWKKAVEREKKAMEFQRIADNSAGSNTGRGVEDSGAGGGDEEAAEASVEAIERKNSEFQKIMDVSSEERDRVQRMQVIDRAAAAIAAARAVLSERSSSSAVSDSVGLESNVAGRSEGGESGDEGEGLGGKQRGNTSVAYSGDSGNGIPGPNFWSWTPPPDDEKKFDDAGSTLAVGKNSSYPITTSQVMEKDRSSGFLTIPFETKLSDSDLKSPIPPLQSVVDVEKAVVPNSSSVAPSLDEEQKREVLFSEHAVEAARALNSVNEKSSSGVNPDGSRWWRETGTERRPDGVLCRWTLTRGVSADEELEWEDKYWEAADQFDYKELGSEKSGRDAAGNVWREYWRESMRQEHGLVHFEKTADKWGKNGKGDEWQEKWWEHYNSSGQTEKWAHKWCSIDPSTHLEAGHAHVWHERWGEKYDGQGGSTKYTDKWAERSEGDGWTKWGDKWDENFNLYGDGVKQGETWWQGKYGEQWNRTWGEHHNGSGWVHKYGKSSSGEHWDTHERQDTWYERFPHFGFGHCFENSVQLREVKRPSEPERDEP